MFDSGGIFDHNGRKQPKRAAIFIVAQNTKDR
jgi:hypothetical protein